MVGGLFLDLLGRHVGRRTDARNQGAFDASRVMAAPKSEILMSVSLAMGMLAGLMSRWVMPSRWA